jgi:signal transduction histidine kinase/CheY-like chemotaxis protein
VREEKRFEGSLLGTIIRMPAARRFLGTISFPLLVLTIGIIATGLATDQVRRSVAAADRERFDFAADRLQDSIQDRVNMYVAMLRAGAGLLAAAEIHSPEQFRAFVDRLALQERYPGVQGIGYSERIPSSELDRVVTAQRGADSEFRVWPEGARPEYHSVLYLEPLDRRNQAAIGYDMFTEPTRRAAMERARDTGAPAASGHVTLVQEIDEKKQPGFLIYMPVYKGGGVPATLNERRHKLQGFVYSPFRAGDLFAGILGRNPRPRAGFELYDGVPSPDSLLYRTSPPGDVGRLSQTRTIDVAGQEWTAQVFSTPALDFDSNQALAPLTAWGGGALTLLLAGLAGFETLARRRALASERAALAESERVSASKDEFLATLSHELRTPLNAVVGWAHMLSSDTLPEEKQRTAVDTILRNARMQSQLIDDLLDMSRIISGRARIDLAVVNVRDVIDAALNAVHPTATAKGIRLAIDAQPGRHVVKGDGSRLQQVVWNLLTNAIKFTPPGGCVTVGCIQRNGSVEISVTDTGIGITPEFLPHVFDRFRQADGSSTRGHGGLGLGLAIVRSLVEMHAGVVHASSQGLNRGATFTVRLPAASGGALLSPEREDGGRAARVDARALEGTAILVVDDDADANDLAREILSQRGARVIAARSGAEALRLLESDRAQPDLIVSDIGMPHMDGYEFIRRVRGLPAEMGGAARAIALTAYAGVEDRMRARAAGYDLHLAKPFLPGDLVGACTALVKGARAV